MRFICLPGGFANAKTFRVQLGPFVEELERDSSATFLFIQGAYETTPPPGFETYFGAGPYYRFTPPEEAAEFENNVTKAVRALPQLDSPEDSLRQALKATMKRDPRAMAAAVTYIREIMDTEGDIDGIIGYSEGAMVAASVLLDEARRKAKGEERRLKAAVFFSGWPPIDPDTGKAVLSDETDECVEVPTIHVMGAADPMLPGSMALYNLCDADSAELFDHGHGHMVPREERVLKELGQVVREVISSVAAS